MLQRPQSCFEKNFVREMELRKVRDESSAPVTALNKYRMRGKNLNKKVNEKDLNEMALLRERKR